LERPSTVVVVDSTFFVVVVFVVAVDLPCDGLEQALMCSTLPDGVTPPARCGLPPADGLPATGDGLTMWSAPRTLGLTMTMTMRFISHYIT